MHSTDTSCIFLFFFYEIWLRPVQYWFFNICTVQIRLRSCNNTTVIFVFNKPWWGIHVEFGRWRFIVIIPIPWGHYQCVRTPRIIENVLRKHDPFLFRVNVMLLADRNYVVLRHSNYLPPSFHRLTCACCSLNCSPSAWSSTIILITAGVILMD